MCGRSLFTYWVDVGASRGICTARKIVAHGEDAVGDAEQDRQVKMEHSNRHACYEGIDHRNQSVYTMVSHSIETDGIPWGQKVKDIPWCFHWQVTASNDSQVSPLKNLVIQL